MLWAAVLLWIVAVLGLTICECLRAFSRSRLLTECRRRGHEDRFRDVLARDEDAILLCHGVSLCTAVLATGLTLAALPETLFTAGAPLAIVGRVAGWLGFVLSLLVVIPWGISHAFAEVVVDRTWPAATLLLKVGRPVISLAEGVRTVLLRIVGRDESEMEAEYISEEIDAVVDEGEREGTLEEGVSQMIQRVVELQNVDVRDVMTPRTELVTLPIDTPFEEARARFIEAGHSRIPVIGESPDDLLGVVYAKDLLHQIDDVPEISSLLREPLIVPESTPVDQLLERMRQRRMHIAMVLDEYGGVVGLVTLEDILEEIVGEISDEYDPETEDDDIVEIDSRTVEVDARTHLDDLNDRFDYELPEDEDYDTVGGFVFSELGHVPTVGEKLVRHGLEFTVVEADRRKIVRLKLQRLDAADVAM